VTEVPPPKDTDVPPSDRGKRPGVPAEEDPLARFDARVLDPATAVRILDGKPLKPTIYRNNRLVVNAKDRAELGAILKAIDGVLAEMSAWADGRPRQSYRRRNADPWSPMRQPGGAASDSSIEPDREWQDQARRLRRAEESKVPLAAVVSLEPAGPDRFAPQAPIDVLEVVQRLRAKVTRPLPGGPAVPVPPEARVGLEHLLFVTINLAPYGASLAPYGASLAPYGASLAPYGASLAGIPLNRSAGGGVFSYLAPGTGGRTPVSLVLEVPDVPLDGPRAVVLDTGCEEKHPWFAEKVARRVAVDEGNGVQSVIGMDVDLASSVETDPEGNACAPDLMTGAIPPVCGHGTFITGILRQKAPSAQISSLRIVGPDGVVPEGALSTAVTEILIKHKQELDKSNGVTGWLDALVLSLGYYLETDDDPENSSAGEHSALGTLLAELASLGVAIFASAGNDSTTRPFYPAAFAVDPRFTAKNCVPLVSVAAENPDQSIALFSNDGDWVTAQAPGASLVSSLPTVMCGGWQPDVSIIGPGNRVRSTIDPDQYSGGFGLWSGTSFAAPVVAGDFLAGLAALAPQASLKERRAIVQGLAGLRRTD
jgi:subtilisin family serine protease